MELIAFQSNLPCQNPNRTQIVTANDEISYENANQVVHYNPCFGFMCLNREQSNNETCLDYKFRQCCASNSVSWTTQTTTRRTTPSHGSN